MNFIIVVNDSPWGSTLAATALRFARAARDAGHDLELVFFRGEGVYNATSGTAADAGTPNLFDKWAEFAGAGTDLMVCQASASRRLNAPMPSPFREAGLVEFCDRLESCDRVLTF